MPPAIMLHTEDPKEVVLRELGDIDDFEIWHNQVLIAIYERPNKTAGGILLTDSSRDEDKHQGKVGLIVKVGPAAFHDAANKWQWPEDFTEGPLHHWVFFKASDGWAQDVNKKRCRVLYDEDIRGRIQHPDQVW